MSLPRTLFLALLTDIMRQHVLFSMEDELCQILGRDGTKLGSFSHQTLFRSVFWRAVCCGILCRSSVFRGCPRVGIVVQWQWSNPPGRLVDTQRWAAPRGPSSSIGAWARAGSWDSPGGRASCNHARLAPRLLGCSCLRDKCKACAL